MPQQPHHHHQPRPGHGLSDPGSTDKLWLSRNRFARRRSVVPVRSTAAAISDSSLSAALTKMIAPASAEIDGPPSLLQCIRLRGEEVHQRDRSMSAASPSNSIAQARPATPPQTMNSAARPMSGARTGPPRPADAGDCARRSGQGPQAAPGKSAAPARRWQSRQDRRHPAEEAGERNWPARTVRTAAKSPKLPARTSVAVPT